MMKWWSSSHWVPPLHRPVVICITEQIGTGVSNGSGCETESAPAGRSSAFTASERVCFANHLLFA